MPIEQSVHEPYSKLHCVTLFVMLFGCGNVTLNYRRLSWVPDCLSKDMDKWEKLLEKMAKDASKELGSIETSWQKLPRIEDDIENTSKENTTFYKLVFEHDMNSCQDFRREFFGIIPV